MSVTSRYHARNDGPPRRPGTIASLVLVLLLAPVGDTVRAGAAPSVLPSADDVSPLFLGIYRKVMDIEDDIRRYSRQYGVDFDLARAVCLYESGGNAALSSGAGARGYFQVMPATFRSLGVRSNVEAGVKYLAQLLRRFEREDRAVAAYNAGPARVGRGGGLPLETVQYVLGVGQYRTVLKLYDAPIRELAERIQLADVREGEDWPALAMRLGAPEWELRLYNPFLAQRRLRAGQRVAYPPAPGTGLFRVVDGNVEYRMRYGDNYIKLALALGLELTAVRSANDLWHVQALPPGTPLRIPLAADRGGVLHAALGLTPAIEPPEVLAVATPVVASEVVVPAAAVRPAPSIRYRVSEGDTLGGLAQRYGTTVRALQRANHMTRTAIRVGQVLTVPGDGQEASPPPERRSIVHRVARGDALSLLARRYRTTVAAIQRANGMERRTRLLVGERLRIPVRR